MDNHDVAALLEEYASLRARAGDQPYRVQAYRRAGSAIASWPDPVVENVRRGWDPQAIPGVGSSLAGVLRDIARRGAWKGLDESRKRYTLQTGEAPPEPRRTRRPAKPPPGALRLRGDLHSHTDATDGRDSILGMAKAAQALGHEYLAITDHSKETRVAGGLDEARMARHLARIRRVGEGLDGIELLAGAEVDIRKDGRLDYPVSLLKQMDVVVCSVHLRHGLSGREQTARILTAMASRHADVLGHPTGRRSGRPGMEIDLEAIAQRAADEGWAVEMNGTPERLDLDADGARLCKGAGALVACDSDAHGTDELGQVKNAVRQAQMAGLVGKDVLNALPLAKLRKRLAR